MKKNALLVLAIVIGLATVTVLSRAIDSRRTANNKQFADEPLYVNGPTARRLSLSFNGLVADWYWMRSLQYIGGKILTYEAEHEGRLDFGRLSSLNIELLPQLLQVSTALDPQFMAPYEYGAMLLPEIDSNQAIALLEYGISQNPSTWRLYHHLGYIYWQRKDYSKASEIYGVGAKQPGAPAWMAAMSARMKAEGGSRAIARDMYQHLYDSSSDQAIKQMVEKQLMRLDSLDERDTIRRVLEGYKAKNGRCTSSWAGVANELRIARIEMTASPELVPAYRMMKLDGPTGAPIDASGVPYELIKNGCDVGLNINTQVPLK